MIELRNLSYRRHAGASTVLDDISLTIPEGRWVSIVGPNGSGKSTLLRLLCGLLRPSAGVMLLDGCPLNAESIETLRRQSGAVFQNPENQFVGETVLDDIVFGLENRCLDRETMHCRIYRYAEQLSITDMLDRQPATLSGGQMQRAALTAVLAMEPRILFFDEAASMLDEDGRRDFIAIMQELRDSARYTIISVTHDPDEMLAADRIIALHEGKLAADGPPLHILQDEQLLHRLNLTQPFMLQLVSQLNAYGWNLPAVWDEKELMSALWSFDSNE